MDPGRVVGLELHLDRGERGRGAGDGDPALASIPARPRPRSGRARRRRVIRALRPWGGRRRCGARCGGRPRPGGRRGRRSPRRFRRSARSSRRRCRSRASARSAPAPKWRPGRSAAPPPRRRGPGPRARTARAARRRRRCRWPRRGPRWSRSRRRPGVQLLQRDDVIADRLAGILDRLGRRAAPRGPPRAPAASPGCAARPATPPPATSATSSRAELVPTSITATRFESSACGRHSRARPSREAPCANAAAAPAATPRCYHPLSVAGWSSQVARRAHNPKVAGSNPAPAIEKTGVKLYPDEVVIKGFLWNQTICIRGHDFLETPEGERVYENRFVLWGRIAWGLLREYETYEDTQKLGALEEHLAREGQSSG